MSVSRLPGGRGPRISDDAIVGQEEIYQQRGNFRPEELIYYYSTMGSTNQATDRQSFAAVGFDLDTLYLLPLPPMSGTFTPVMASIHLSLGGGPPPHRVEYAIYRYVEGSPDQFIQMPQTRQEVSFEGGTPAPGGKYNVTTSDIGGGGAPFNFSGNFEAGWLGYQVKDQGTIVYGQLIADPVLPYYKLPIAAGGDLPIRISRTNLIREQDDAVFMPAITYKTKRGARMFGEF